MTRIAAGRDGGSVGDANEAERGAAGLGGEKSAATAMTAGELSCRMLLLGLKMATAHFWREVGARSLG